MTVPLTPAEVAELHRLHAELHAHEWNAGIDRGGGRQLYAPNHAYTVDRENLERYRRQVGMRRPVAFEGDWL